MDQQKPLLLPLKKPSSLAGATDTLLTTAMEIQSMPPDGFAETELFAKNIKFSKNILYFA